MSQKKSKWDAEVRIAKEGVETGLPPLRWGQCQCKDNELLLRFLTAASEKLDASAREGSSGPFKLGAALGYASTSVRKCLVPITSTNMLLTLNKVGPAIAKIVAEGLWTQYPPAEDYAGPDEAPPEPSKPSKKKGKRSSEGEPVVAPEEKENDEAPKKKRARAPKEYVPRKGTANYAFLMCMFRAVRQDGQSTFGKKELMDVVEASQLADKSVFGASAAGAVATGQVHKAYDGWSCMQKLVNDDPPLVQRFSNPVKVRLTPEGEALAARLYAIALTAGEVPPLPGFDAAETLADAARAAPAPSSTAAAAETAHAPAAPDAVAAPKRKTKACKTAGTSAVEPAALAPADAPHEGVSVVDASNPSGRGVAESMGAKLVAKAAHAKKRRRVPVQLEDLPASPTVAARKRGFSWGSDFASDKSGAAPALPHCTKTPTAACGPLSAANAAAVASSPRTSDILNPDFNPLRRAGERVTTAAAPASATALHAALARRRAPLHSAVTPSTGGLESSGEPRSQPPASTRVALPALPSAVAGDSRRAQSTQHAQQAAQNPDKQATPPKSSGNNAVIDLLDSDDESPRNNTPVATTGAAAAAAVQPLTTNVARAGPSCAHAGRAQSPRRVNRRSYFDSPPQCIEPCMGLESPRASVSPPPSHGIRGDLGAMGSYPNDVHDDVDLSPHDLERQRAMHAPSPPVSFAPPPSAAVNNQPPSRDVTGGAFDRDPPVDAKRGSPPFKRAAGVVKLPALPAAAAAKRHSPTGTSRTPKHQSAPAGTSAAAAGPGGLLTKCVAAEGGRTPPDEGLNGNGKESLAKSPAGATQEPRTKAAQNTGAAVSAAADADPEGNVPVAPAPLSKAASAPAAPGGTQQMAVSRTAAAWQLPVLTQQSLDAPGSHIRHPPIPPSHSFFDLYEIVVAVDQREQFDRGAAGAGRSRNESLAVHLEHIRAFHAAEARTLPVGDLAWIARCTTAVPGGPAIGEEWVLDWIVERKAGDDLVSSILDGRYNRQKILMARCGLRTPCYAVEGDLGSLPTGAKAAKTAACETEIWSGFKVLHTRNQGDTKRLYVLMTSHLKAVFRTIPKGGSLNARHQEPLPTFRQWRTACADNQRVTVRELWGRVLCSIPRVGAETADAILKRYPTPASLFSALRTTHATAARQGRPGDAACMELLARVPVTMSRKVGNAAGRAMYDTLFAAV